MPSQQKWDQHWLQVAQITSELSKDPSTKVGAVIVTPDNRQCSLGYNGFAAGIEETEEMWNVREIKLKHVIHAEENCLLNCPFNPDGCSIYITHQPCPKCIIKLAQSRIKKIIYYKKYEKMGDIDIWNMYAKKFDEILQLNISTIS
jgi:dCMP deaminase